MCIKWMVSYRSGNLQRGDDGDGQIVVRDAPQGTPWLPRPIRPIRVPVGPHRWDGWRSTVASRWSRRSRLQPW